MTHSPGGDWLMWPQAVAWLICGDRDEVAKIGEFFRARMASNQSADIVFDIHMARLPQKHVVGPVDGGPMGAMEQAEASLFDMLEAGTVISEGKRTAAESPVQIQANDWRDTTMRAARTFDLQDRHSRVTKFYDVRVLASGLPGWGGDALKAAVAERTDLGVMPANAKPNNFKHEGYAHQAAQIVRSKKILPQAACREVAPDDGTRAIDSVVAAIRRSYDLMYGRDGFPLKN